MSKKTDVINYIQTQIETNSLKPGQRLLSEEDLAKKLKVSRTTIRLALTDLVLQGTIEKRPSSGNYISNKKVSKKYILFLLGQTEIYSKSSCQTYTMEKLKSIVIEKGFIPQFIINDGINDFTDYIKLDKNEIAGVFSCYSEWKYNYFIKYKIPVITLVNFTAKSYPAVIFDYELLYRDIESLLKKYSYKNIFMFHYIHNQRGYSENFAHLGAETYLKEKYNIKSFSVNLIKNNAKKVFSKAIESEKPDLIIFTNDNIYKECSEYLSRELTDTKIITISNIQDTFAFNDNICRIAFDLEERCIKAMNLLEKHIKGEFIGTPHIYIKPKIINEETLIKDK